MDAIASVTAVEAAIAASVVEAAVFVAATRPRPNKSPNWKPI